MLYEAGHLGRARNAEGRCADCGAPVWDDSHRWIGDEWVCRDCAEVWERLLSTGDPDPEDDYEDDDPLWLDWLGS